MAGGSSAQVSSSCLGIRLLGPVEITIGGQPRPLPKLVHRILLAILASADGHVVPASSLVEELWHEDSSPRRRKNLQTHVYQLRRVLSGLGPGCGAGMIVTRPPGYLLTVTECELDLHALDDLVAAARESAHQGDFPQARALYRQALALWRGPTLADVHACAPVLGGLADRLEERRIAILEERIEADLAAGLHADLIPELSGLVAQHPLRERLRARLMLSLHRCGRQAEALAAYQDARDVLLDQLGLDPGAELQDLHQRILNGDTALAGSTGQAACAPDAAAPDTVIVAAPAPVPHELPAPDSHFIGRDGQLAALTRLLAEDASGTITAISGTAGVGKTALAVRWAHQVAGRFPDGQLYVNLRGYDPGEPLAAADALAAFLRSLGRADRDIPADCAERAARFRSLMADRRVLVVLDNAADAEQVRPLLPGASGCLTVITSRNPLAGLVARNGAKRIDLSPLSADGAIGLLRILLGGRADAEAHTVALVARLCGRLPLALRVFAERAAGRPALPLTALASELTDSRRRLDLLDADGDGHTSVRTVLSWSYRQLRPRSAHLFRLCALYPGAELDADAAAALAGSGAADVRESLGELARASLVQVSERGHYLMHDLLREYARELAFASLAEAQRHAALTRLYEYYLGKAAAAVDSLFPAEQARRLRISGNTAASWAFASPEAARRWLDGERATLLTMVVHAAREDRPGFAARLTLTLHRYLNTYGYYHEELAVIGHALDAARRSGDLAAEAWLLNYLGATNWHLGRLRLASECHERTLSLFRKAADRLGEADVLCSLGAYDLRQGRYRQAAEQYRTAASLASEADDWRGEQRALTSLAVLDLQHGRYPHAAHRLGRALSLARSVGHRHLEAHTLSILGQVELRWGRYQLAGEHLAQALLLNHDLGNRKIEADTLSALGLLSSRQGGHRHAIGQLRQSLALCRAIGDLMIEQQTLNNLGEVFLALGRPAAARAWYDRALSLSDQIGDRFEQARAYAGLAAVADVLDDLAAGRAHWQQALLIYRELGAPEAEQISAAISHQA